MGTVDFGIIGQAGFLTRTCPICGSAARILRRLVQKGETDWRIVTCGSCQFVYVPEIRLDTYVAHQEPPAGVPVKSRHRHIKRLCDEFFDVDRIEHPLSVLEIGSGWGALARVFAEDERYHYTGFEPSRGRADYCRAQGYDVAAKMFDSSVFPERVQAVVIDNVLEHVEDPARLLRAAVDVLIDGGLLIVIVPNLNDVRQLHPVWREKHHWQPHCHINYFSTRHLAELYAENGMQLRFFGPESLDGTRDLVPFVRVFADRIGVHAFGLNTYGVKPLGDH